MILLRGLRRGGATLAAGFVVAAAVAASCRSLPDRAPVSPPALLQPAFDGLVPGPSLRVGILTDARRVSIAADSAVDVWVTGDRAGRPRSVQRATFGAVSGALPEASRYRVQVASLASETAARLASMRAKEASGLPPTVQWNEATSTYQVRVGAFATREEARALADRLSWTGLRGAFVAEETSAELGGVMRLQETEEEVSAATVVPGYPGEILTVDGTPYRGLIEVRPNGAGSLTVVNIVNVEDYLRGVVPNELSPQAFPQIEALKAQAVAARTYALRNRGQFRNKGYDICATPACQVYRGMATESPLTDRAVEETRGVVGSWGDGLINALYTSTCGGHTEDSQHIFEGEPVPYLKGVACAPERSAWGAIRTAAATESLGDEEGLNRDAALLVALGVVEPRLYDAKALKGFATDAEVRSWTARLVTALRRKGCPGAEPPLARRAGFFHHVVASLCWEERAQRLLSPDDPEYLLQVEDGAGLVGNGERLAAALLIQEGVLSPFPDNTLRPGIPVTRAQAVRLLARAARRAGVPGLVVAEFRGAEAGELHVRRGEALESHPLDRSARLFRTIDGSAVAASEISLAAGDVVRFVIQDGRVVFLEAEQSRLGAAADRTSRYYRWEVRSTPAEVAQGLSRYGSVGRVKDVVPRKIGVSGRVVELAVVGTDGELVLRGLKVRWALGLRENLFVVDRETDVHGAVERFVFTGKGWGHGVGLCQVGAYGMAVAGATYEEILGHYYTGLRLDKAY